MIVDIDNTDEHATITASGFRLDFEWASDRWAHSIALASGNDWQVVARSVEGDAGRDGSERIVSPAFQQLRIERSGSGAQALVIGQSGPHRFSAVFQMRAVDNVVYVESDIVDRCRGPIEALASTYRVELTSSDLERADPSGVAWRRDEWAGGRLSFLPWGPPDRHVRIALAEAGRSATQVQAEALLDASTATQRWFYQWRWEVPTR